MSRVAHAIVLLGGTTRPALRPDVQLDLPADAFVIAADSGLALAAPLGLRADVVVGDLDSVDPDLLAAAAADGTQVHVHPADKDATDFELALRHAVTHGVARLTVVGGADGRADHHLANVALLGAPWLAHVEVVAQLGAARCTVVRATAELVGVAGSLVSLLPLGGTAGGVTTRGLRWELADADLAPHTSLAVSNELVGEQATVTLRSGVLLAVQPDSGARPLEVPPENEPTTTRGPQEET